MTSIKDLHKSFSNLNTEVKQFADNLSYTRRERFQCIEETEPINKERTFTERDVLERELLLIERFSSEVSSYIWRRDVYHYDDECTQLSLSLTDQQQLSKNVIKDRDQTRTILDSKMKRVSELEEENKALNVRLARKLRREITEQQRENKKSKKDLTSNS